MVVVGLLTWWVLVVVLRGLDVLVVGVLIWWVLVVCVCVWLSVWWF